MILTKKILILEDNLKVLSSLLKKLSILEDDSAFDFEIMILTSSDQANKYINTQKNPEFDIVLLDRDCKLHQSFHVLDIEKIGVDRIVGISSVTRYNDDLKKRGVIHIIEKDISDIDSFAENVVREVRSMLLPAHLNKFLQKKEG